MPAKGPCGPENGGIPFSGLGSTPGGAPTGTPDAIVRRSADEDEHRDAIRSHWGPKGVIDLTFALQMGRMFPMMKAALGYAKECRRISVDGKQIDVVKQAA